MEFSPARTFLTSCAAVSPVHQRLPAHAGAHVPAGLRVLPRRGSAVAMHKISEVTGGMFSFIEDHAVIQDALAQCIGGFYQPLCNMPRSTSNAGTTTRNRCFAGWLRQSAKALLHSAKSLPSVALGKELSAIFSSVKGSLPSAFCRTLGKDFVECLQEPSAKKSCCHGDFVTDGRFAECLLGGHSAKTKKIICQVSPGWALGKEFFFF